MVHMSPPGIKSLVRPPSSWEVYKGEANAPAAPSIEAMQKIQNLNSDWRTFLAADIYGVDEKPAFEEAELAPRRVALS